MTRRRATPAQVGLAWLMAQKPWTVPLPGTGKAEQLRENMETAQLRLTRHDLRGLETGLDRLEIYGGRMDARQMAQIGQD